MLSVFNLINFVVCFLLTHLFFAFSSCQDYQQRFHLVSRQLSLLNEASQQLEQISRLISNIIEDLLIFYHKINFSTLLPDLIGEAVDQSLNKCDLSFQANLDLLYIVIRLYLSDHPLQKIVVNILTNLLRNSSFLDEMSQHIADGYQSFAAERCCLLLKILLHFVSESAEKRVEFTFIFLPICSKLPLELLTADLVEFVDEVHIEVD